MRCTGALEMKQPEYTEGQRATENFERGMKSLFKVPKAAIVRAEKKKQKKSSSLRKQKRADKD
jgi:hypothetical protein